MTENGFHLTQVKSALEIPEGRWLVGRQVGLRCQVWPEIKDSRVISIYMVIEATEADDTVQGEYAE